MLLRLLAVLLVLSWACGSDDNGSMPDPTPTPDPDPTSTPQPTPTPGPDPTPTTEPTPDPLLMVTFERVDAASECDGLLPTTAPEPVTFTRSPPAGEVCGGGVSDGTGHIALTARRAAGEAGSVTGPVRR